MEIFTTIVVLLLVLALIIGLLLFLIKKYNIFSLQPEDPESKIEKSEVFLEAKQKSFELVLEAKNEALRVKNETDEYVRTKKSEISEESANLSARKTLLTSHEEEYKKKQESLETLKSQLEVKIKNFDELIHAEQEKLEKISKLTVEEAKKRLLETVDRDLKDEYGKRIRTYEEDFKKKSDEKAKEILIDAMRQGATDYVVEHTSSRIKLPDDELKGRIIGKEGRNIKTFEELTGVEVDLDSSPGDLLISCFDPVRREVAKLSMEKLIADGRIQPAKIEEIVEKTKTEMEQLIYKEGADLCHKLGIYNIPKEIIQTLGRYRYRFSYGQNMIEHVMEVVKIGASIANEVKADVELVKLGCLFHDIGKVIMDREGSHVEIGVDYLKKFKINEKVVNCVAEHHEDKPFSSLESAIVALADHVSGARPGSRTEDYENYVKRMRNLEEAATSFDGVDYAFALSAGREVRVYVKPNQVDDYSTSFLAREIAKKIELEQTYPGVVKIVVIRETRQQATAK
jgi:ribonuclease Y